MRRHVTPGRIFSALALALLPILGACQQIGPERYKASFEEYGQAVRTTLDQQMLTNLVRMRYYEAPMFLQVSSVNTQFSVGGNAGATGTFPQGGNNTLGVSAGGSYEERPTISFSIPESRAFYGRLLSPVSADQVTSLAMAGYDAELVLRTAVRRLNRLENISAGRSGPAQVPQSYPQFREAVRLITSLRDQDAVDLEFGSKAAAWSSPVAADPKGDIGPVRLIEAVNSAMKNGAEIVQDDDGKWQAYLFERHMTLQFAPVAFFSADAARLRELLGLDPKRGAFPIVDPELVNAEKPKTVMGRAPGALDPSTVWSEIGLRGRSMMEIMQLAAHTVEVPEAHLRRGIVFTVPATTADDDAQAMVIRTSCKEPCDHQLRTQYRGNWFYIDDRDLHSRETFHLITALFAGIGGTVPGAHPVLTLPVGR